MMKRYFLILLLILALTPATFANPFYLDVKAGTLDNNSQYGFTAGMTFLGFEAGLIADTVSNKNMIGLNAAKSFTVIPLTLGITPYVTLGSMDEAIYEYGASLNFKLIPKIDFGIGFSSRSLVANNKHYGSGAFGTVRIHL